MNQDEFRSKSGVTGADDADQQEEIEQEQEEIVEEEQQEQESQEVEETTEEDELPPLNEKEKTAFEKRMERERAKERDKLEAEYRQKYARHDEVIAMLGGDPDAIEKRIRENKIAADAQRLAEVNNWSEEDTQWYINDRNQKNEVKEMRVQIAINKLSSNPDYAGIATMEKQILDKIDKSNGALSVEEAYWALGGPKKTEQIRLEAQMREAEKRKKPVRTVISDSAAATSKEKPLPPEIVREAEKMGISIEEARRLMAKEPAGTIEEYRKRKAK